VSPEELLSNLAALPAGTYLVTVHDKAQPFAEGQEWEIVIPAPPPE
jgi:hypothetical protein